MVKNKFSKEKKDYFVIKCPLSKIIKNPNDTPTIDEAVMRTHKIVINTYQFIKLYLISLFEQKLPFPVINEHFISTCMSVLTTIKSSQGKIKDETLQLKNTLTQFYDEHYYALNSEKVPADLLTRALDYEAAGMITSITNNIKAHFVSRINCYFNLLFQVKATVKSIKKSSLSQEEKRKQTQDCYSKCRKAKNDFYNLTGKNFESEAEDLKWIFDLKTLLIPNKVSFKENIIPYDVKANPLDYLPSMIKLCQLFEQNGYKLFHAFPLRSSIKPMYIRIDTSSLINLLVPVSKRRSKKDQTPKQTTKTEYSNKINHYKTELWARFFKTEKKCFRKKGYEFHSMIETDGVGVSIYLSRPKRKKEETNENKREHSYIDKIPITPEIKNKKVVGIDPGKSDIIYCIDENRETFRYTANQRRFETGAKKYNKYLNKDKDQMIDEYSVRGYETALSRFASKSCVLNKVEDYINAKSIANSKLFKFYQDSKARKFKLNRYFNTQRSESTMVNNFKKKYGGPEETIIGFGDHTQGRQMKHLEPTKDIGMRRLFEKHGYQVYLVNEFRTSLKCHKCKWDTEKFKYEKSHKPKSVGELRLVHGLIRCTNVKCGIKWNRDYNGSLNILEIAKAAIEGKGRPKELCQNSAASRG